MKPSLYKASSNYGWLLALGVALAAFLMAWLATNPVEEAADHVVAPGGRSVGFGSQLCPDGWENTSSASLDAPVKSCTKGNWVVVLKSDGSFSHGVELNKPGVQIIYDESKVLGWK